MKSEAKKQIAKLALVVTATALLLSFIWRVPYIFTVAGFSAWAFFGHLITADDDMPGGFSNPDGSLPSLRGELAIKGIVLLALLGLIAFVPSLWALGGKS